MSAEWYYQVMGQVVGPESANELRSEVAKGVVTRETLVRKGDQGEWVPAWHLKGLFPTPSDLDPRQPPISGTARTQRADETSPPLPSPSVRNNPKLYVLAPLVMSAIAVALSLAALVVSIGHDPLGGGIDEYDLTDPERSLISTLQMEVDGDFRAVLDIQRLLGGKLAKEKLQTLKVHKASDYAGKRVLFVSYEKNGISQYDTAERVNRFETTPRRI